MTVSCGNSERMAGRSILLFLLVLSLTTLHGGCAGVVGSGAPSGPTVSITSPTAGATVSTSIVVSANASANTVGVQFKLDGANLGSEKTSAPYSISWDTTATANGQHTLTAMARNAGGQTGTSSALTVTVQNSSGGPTVSITSPTSGATVSASITVSANASANTVGVQFKLDGGNLGSEVTSAPFSISWDATTTANGQHTLAAVARNAAGQTVTSAPVTITVQNSSGGNPPVISGVGASPSSTSASIFWTTDKFADSQLDYGTTASYDQSSALDLFPEMSHSIAVGGLAPSTLYHYRVRSKDDAGRLSTSADFTFTTVAPGGGIPSGLGWFQISNTKLASVCDDNNPATHAIGGCAAIITAWNGGIAQTSRNRLVVWGGGHSDYFGNEVYALDLNDLNFIRLDNPSPTTNVQSCPEAYVDNTPSSRHTYGGIVYVSNMDSMFVYGGSLSNCGFLGNATWFLQFPGLQWTRKDPTAIPANNPASDPCVQADYDPTTQTVLLHDANLFYKYVPATNTYTVLNTFAPLTCPTGAIDPIRRTYYFFDVSGVWKIDYSGPGPTYNQVQLTTTGCGPLTSAYVPGLAYDSRQQKIVGWAGGNTVYVFDPATNVCTPVTYSGGPGPQQLNGTWGRFRYFPNLGVFAVVNDWQQNAFTLRLTPVP